MITSQEIQWSRAHQGYATMRFISILMIITSLPSTICSSGPAWHFIEVYFMSLLFTEPAQETTPAFEQEPESVGESQPGLSSTSGPESEPESETETDSEPEPESEPETESESESESDSEPESQPESEWEPGSEQESESKPEWGSE